MKKLITVILAVLVCNLGLVTGSVAGQSAGADQTAKVKKSVRKLGIGAEVEVTRASGDKMRGRISDFKDDHFSIIPKKATTPMDLNYVDVAKVKRHSPISPGVSIAILGGVIVAFVFILRAAASE